MKIVVCPDSFKGSLSSKEVTSIISRTIKKYYPEADILEIPLADGGEGTSDVIRENIYTERVDTKAHDPLGRLIQTKYYKSADGEKVLIESADIIGLPLLKEEERNPLKASSYGLGELIREAIERGGKDITVSLGGTATCDGGKGMMEALNSCELGNIHFTAIADVTNPLLGDNGAVKIFAPQKGAALEDIPVLEKRLEDFFESAKLKGICKSNDAIRDGSGAAGGLGFAFQTFLKADCKRGIDFVLEKVDFKGRINKADLIITGEGKVDSQSLMGKVLNGVIETVMPHKIPIIIIAGRVNEIPALKKSGVVEIYEISNPNLSPEENMKHTTAVENLVMTTELMLKSNIFQQLKEKL